MDLPQDESPFDQWEDPTILKVTKWISSLETDSPQVKTAPDTCSLQVELTPSEIDSSRVETFSETCSFQVELLFGTYPSPVAPTSSPGKTVRFRADTKSHDGKKQQGESSPAPALVISEVTSHHHPTRRGKRGSGKRTKSVRDNAWSVVSADTAERQVVSPAVGIPNLQPASYSFVTTKQASIPCYQLHPDGLCHGHLDWIQRDHTPHNGVIELLGWENPQTHNESVLFYI